MKMLVLGIAAVGLLILIGGITAVVIMTTTRRK
jgi:hypothetical protein